MACTGAILRSLLRNLNPLMITAFFAVTFQINIIKTNNVDNQLDATITVY